MQGCKAATPPFKFAASVVDGSHEEKVEFTKNESKSSLIMIYNFTDAFAERRIIKMSEMNLDFDLDDELDYDTECLDVSVTSDGIDGSGNFKFICRLEHKGHQSYRQSFGVYFSTQVAVEEVPGDVDAEVHGNHVIFSRKNQMNENGLVDIWVKLSASEQPEVTGITDVTCLPETRITKKDLADCTKVSENIAATAEASATATEEKPADSKGQQINAAAINTACPDTCEGSPVLKAIHNRRSVRSYKSNMLPKETIAQIAQAGTYAASGMNRQSPIIIAVTNKNMRDKLSAMNAKIMGTETDPFYGAPVVMIVLADKEVPTYIYDGSLVIGNMMLAAEELGIGSCWIHRAKEEFESEEGKEILKQLGIEGNYEGIGHLILGYEEGEKKPAAPRKEKYIYFYE